MVDAATTEFSLILMGTWEPAAAMGCDIRARGQEGLIFNASNDLQFIEARGTQMLNRMEGIRARIDDTGR
jgi:hypothetical protein